MKTVGDWKVNEAWLQQVYKHVYVWIKQIYSVCNSLNAKCAVANTMYTNSSKTFIDQGLRQHNVKNAGPSYCLVSGSDKTQLNPAELLSPISLFVYSYNVNNQRDHCYNGCCRTPRGYNLSYSNMYV